MEMPTEIMVALIGLAGSAIGAFAGVLTSARLTNYRIEQLEKKVEKHNNLVERMALVEASTKSAHHRLDEMREEIDNG